MATVWEVTLPQSPLLANYEEAPKDATIRSQMSYGPDKVRNLTTGVIINVTMRMLMTLAQTQTLDVFYNTTIGRVGTIDWINHRTGAAAVYRFTAPPKYTPAGIKYHVSLQMEILP